MKTQSKEITVRISLSSIFPCITDRARFEDHKKILKTLSDSSRPDLSADEMQQTISILSEWEDDTIAALKSHASDMNALLSFIREPGLSIYREETIDLEALANSTGTETLFQDYLRLKDELNQIKEFGRPVAPQESAGTIEENILARKEYELTYAKWSLAVERRDREVTIAARKWKAEIQKHEEIQKIRAKAEKYTRNLKGTLAECKSIGRSARLAVTLKDSTLRNSIQSLIDFDLAVLREDE